MSNIKRTIYNIFYPFSRNSNNSKLEESFTMPDRPVYGFYHIFAFNNWKEIVDEQFSCIKQSGLYDLVDTLYISLISKSIEPDIEYIKTKWGGNLDVIYTGNEPTAYEFPALEHLYTKSAHDDFYCFYFHTKGSSNSAKTFDWYKDRIKTLEQLIAISSEWRKFINYHNFTKYKLAIAALENKYISYGADYQTHPSKQHYYAGNFWWSSSEHIRTRPVFSSDDKKWRFNAETWLLKDVHTGFYDAFRMNIDLGAVKMVPEVYTSTGIIKSIGTLKLWLRHMRFSLKKVSSRIK